MLSFGISLSALLALAPFVSAQQPVYAQCGGQGWSGGTTCVSRSTCTYSNPYYSQCLPGSATSTATQTPTTTSTSAPTGTAPAGVNYWFSFGDSYTSTTFSITGVQPSLANPLGNPPYPGYTGGGGANWVDYLTTVNNRSKILTYNYAYGGATIDANLVKPYQTTVLSLIDQLGEFQSTVASKPASVPWTATNALFSVWIGINDIGGSFYQSGDRAAFSDTLLNAYFAQVQKLYNSGGRIFLFVNVPPIERSPLMLAQSTDSQALEKTVIQGFNSKLAAKISAFKAANSGVTTYLWDSNAAFTTILNAPTTYGFSDATSYGGAKSFWGNDYHPGAAAHAIFAKQIGQLLGSTPW